GPGKFHLTDQGPGSPPGLNGQPGFADQVKAMEEVLFAKLRKEAVMVNTRALEAFRSGDHDTALEMLRDFKQRLQEAELAPERIPLLQRSVETRYQQFKVLKAQIEIKGAQQAALANKGVSREGMRQINQQKRDQLVADKLKEFDDLFRQKKFKQA